MAVVVHNIEVDTTYQLKNKTKKQWKQQKYLKNIYDAMIKNDQKHRLDDLSNDILAGLGKTPTSKFSINN